MTASAIPGHGVTADMIVERMPVAMVLANQDGLILQLNGKIETLFGFDREEMIGRPLELFIQIRSAPGRDAVGMRKNGVPFPVEIELTKFDAAGASLTLASIRDISAGRKELETEQRMTALVESADDAIITKTLDGIIRSWNSGAERLLGYTAQEIIGQPVTRLLPPERQGEEAMILDQIKSGQRFAHFETVRCRRDGSRVDVSLTISPIRDRAGSIVGASKIMRDISQRKQAEENLRRSNDELAKINAELDEFVYTASHDLRAPLTGVGAVAQWILEDDHALATESRERLKLIQGRIERMKRLLNDIRDYARTGRYAESSGPRLSAAALVAEAAANSNVPPAFNIFCSPEMQHIEVDRMPLEQVLLNLIGNAVKHHDKSAGNVTISAATTGAALTFFVTDDGPGVPQAHREEIFEMFKTLKPRDQVEGSGMGLALVRRIVERMGGRCGVESADERGARFWFEWPKCGREIR